MILEDQAADLIGRDRRGQLRRGGVGAEEPAADGQRELFGVFGLLVVGALQEGRHAVQRIEADVGGDLVQDRLEVFPRDRVGDLWRPVP